MSQLGDRAESLGGVFHETALDDLVHVLCELRMAVGTDGTIEGGLCWECWRPRGIHRPTFKGKPTGDHLEQNDAEGVDIGTDIDRPGVVELLGGHVSPRA